MPLLLRRLKTSSWTSCGSWITWRQADLNMNPKWVGGGKDRGWERQHPQQLSGGSAASCQHIPLCFSNVRVPVLAVSMSSGLAGAYSSVVINQTLRYAALA